MGEAARRQEYLEKAARLLHEQEKDAQPVPAKCSRCGKEELRVVGQACECGGTFLHLPPPLAPQVQMVLRMAEPARISIFNIDLLLQLVGGMANQVGLAGGPHLAQGFAQFIPMLQEFRNQVMQREGSGLVIAGAGDLPPAPPG